MYLPCLRIFISIRYLITIVMENRSKKILHFYLICLFNLKAGVEHIYCYVNIDMHSRLSIILISYLLPYKKLIDQLK